MDGGAWEATVIHGVAKSQTGLSEFTFTFISLGIFFFYKLSISLRCIIHPLFNTLSQQP